MRKLSLATSKAHIERAVATILVAIGEDPNRDGLKRTPDRVARMFLEMTDGMRTDPDQHLRTSFDVKHDELVILKDVRFSSLCEHHMLPFHGVVSLGYLPGKRVVGLSKLARCVHAYAARLQVQERLTEQIANALMVTAQARGAAVVITSTHECMVCRGVKAVGAQMVTSSMLGEMRTNNALRNEFLRLIGAH